MKYSIQKKKSDISINITDIGNKKSELIKQVQACQSGNCSCPSDEYNKVDSIQISDSKSDINIKIIAKDDNSIDENEIEKCLSHTDKLISD
ncbi:MAG: hypothetical protein HQL46_00910 [Gammaproteobacteria bacterium]|nr:hypothetical protein [Gammaproteobacteria bacterium]